MKQQGALNFYFGNCREFVGLLDAIRDNYEPHRYNYLSLILSRTLKIPMHEVVLIQLYLLTGRFEPSAYFSKVLVLTGEDIYNAEYPDKKSVFLNLMPDATKDDVVNYVESNWPEVREILDSNFPKRKRRTVEIRRLNDWLQIAEKVYLYKKEGEFNKEDFYSDLAHDYGIPSSEVKAHAKHYRPLMKLKYPSFKPDENSDDMTYSESYEGDRRQ